MVNKTRLKTMIRLAEYEESQGRRDLPIHRYYRGDYIALHLVRTFFLTTIAFGLLLFLIMAASSETVFGALSRMDLGTGLFFLLLSYISLLAITMVITITVCWNRYTKARGNIRQYERALEDLEREYEREEA